MKKSSFFFASAAALGGLAFLTACGDDSSANANSTSEQNQGFNGGQSGEETGYVLKHPVFYIDEEKQLIASSAIRDGSYCSYENNSFVWHVDTTYDVYKISNDTLFIMKAHLYNGELEINEDYPSIYIGKSNSLFAKWKRVRDNPEKRQYVDYAEITQDTIYYINYYNKDYDLITGSGQVCNILKFINDDLELVEKCKKDKASEALSYPYTVGNVTINKINNNELEATKEGKKFKLHAEYSYIESIITYNLEFSFGTQSCTHQGYMRYMTEDLCSEKYMEYFDARELKDGFVAYQGSNYSEFNNCLTENFGYDPSKYEDDED